MLLTEAKFKTFTPKEVCNATRSTRVLAALSRDSREQVDEMARQSVAAGGSTCQEPQDNGLMYGRGFQALDGYIRELIYMGALRRRPGLEALSRGQALP